MAATIPFGSGKAAASPSTIPFSQSAPPAPPQNLATTIWSGLSNYGSQVVQSAKAGFGEIVDAGKAAGPIGGDITKLPEAGLAAAGGIADIAGAPFSPLASAATSPVVNTLAQHISNSPTFQQFAQGAGGDAATRLATDILNASKAAGLAASVAGGPKAITATKDTASTFAKSLIPTDAEAAAAQASTAGDAIYSNYTRAIKPTIVGQKSASLMTKYKGNVVQAVSSIAENKDALSFETDGGTEIARLPQSPMEFSQAIDQTKNSLFQKYNSLATEAGDKGIKIDAAPIAQSLDKVINNEALKVTNPAAISYAEDLKARLSTSAPEPPAGMSLDEYIKANGDTPPFKQFSPEVTQQIIKNYNDTLEAFYRNPSYDNATKAAIEAGVVREFRGALDTAINSATGENYQALKSQYGALAAIEKDVTKRAIVLARQHAIGSAQGLGKYMDVFSGGDIVQGLLTLNPSLFAKGAAQAGFTRFFQYLNSPDRAIQNMFHAAGKLTKSGQSVPSSPIQPTQ